MTLVQVVKDYWEKGIAYFTHSIHMAIGGVVSGGGEAPPRPKLLGPCTRGSVHMYTAVYCLQSRHDCMPLPVAALTAVLSCLSHKSLDLRHACSGLQRCLEP